MVNGEPKRFFDEPSVRSLFTPEWRLLSLEHFTTRKYMKSKSLWEAVVERDAQPFVAPEVLQRASPASAGG